ncbi:NADH-dependent flavin oxidoreductase [Halomonas sp. DP8Y7-1]|uniref:NADH-dependent flavin oxidoreductase n=1 Tax=Halomonas sp. DP8Y7-1 TaxID=2859078 RepID=UPI001C93D674|nr:NADH-dependent flavin oxidoreductase [Halomonas sp. DP8Y7-1]MBY6029720.1 NADH-dependent flavin oxidoreductase [Halomonas sp. DP8Y7-1]
MSSTDTLFRSFSFARGVTLRNRVVMAPMTTWSSNDDETISDQELAWYRARAQGVGMVITGCTHVQRSGIGFTDEFAAYDDRFIPSLRRLADAAKSGGAHAVLQIFHAGNKAVPHLIPDGDLVSASAGRATPGPFNSGDISSRALDHEEIREVIRAFGEATRRAIDAGFDGIELHGAHGFLIQNFFSPRFNQRNDEWGGSLENRMRFPLEVVREVKRVISLHAQRPFLLGYRFSPEEADEGALRITDACALMDQLVEEQVDYLHVSLKKVLSSTPQDSVSGGRTNAEIIIDRVADRVPLLAAGEIYTAQQARDALALGLPLVAVGRGLAVTPDWVELAKAGDEFHIRKAMDMSQDPARNAIPNKLWHIIRTTPGWFPRHEGA